MRPATCPRVAAPTPGQSVARQFPIAGRTAAGGGWFAGPSVDNKVFTLVVVVVCLFFITAWAQANGSALQHLPAALAAVAMILRYGGKSQRKKKRKRD